MEGDLFSRPRAEKPAYRASSPLSPDSSGKLEEAAPAWQLVPPIITGQLPIVDRDTLPGDRPLWVDDAIPQFFGQNLSEQAPVDSNEGKLTLDGLPAQSGQASGWQRGVKPGLPPAGYVSRWNDPPFGLRPLWQKDLRQSRKDTLAKEKERARSLLQQLVQPGFAGVVNSSVVTWTPLFAVALLTQRPFTAFLVGVVSALGVGLTRMLFGLAEMSKGNKPTLRNGVTGLLACCGDIALTLPFLLPTIRLALSLAVVVIALKLVILVVIHSTSTPTTSN